MSHQTEINIILRCFHLILYNTYIQQHIEKVEISMKRLSINFINNKKHVFYMLLECGHIV